MSRARPGSEDWQKRNRKFAVSCHYMFADIGWGALEIPLYLLIRKSVPSGRLLRLTEYLDSGKLSQRLSSTNPAFYEELVSKLRSSKFAPQPEVAEEWKEVPTIVDMVMNLTSGCVKFVKVSLIRPVTDITLGNKLSDRR